MSTDHPNPVLSFSGVYLEGRAERLSFDLHPGKVVFLHCCTQSALPDVACLASGLKSPEHGEVRFKGERWSDRAPSEVLEARRGIGRVYDPRSSAVWCENLNLDENVALSAYFNAGATHESVEARLSEVRQDFGLLDLPGVRPSKASLRAQTLTQWVRAFLPDPMELLILEDPGYGAHSQDLEVFQVQIERCLAAGTAILWLDYDTVSLDTSDLEIAHKFECLPQQISSGISYEDKV